MASAYFIDILRKFPEIHEEMKMLAADHNEKVQEVLLLKKEEEESERKKKREILVK